MRSTVPVLVVLALLLSACGGSGSGEAAKPVAQILSDATNAVRSAKSAHFTLVYSLHGKTRVVHNTWAAPTRSAGDTTKNGYRLAFIRIGRTMYTRTTASNLKSLGFGSMADTIAGKWLKLPFSYFKGLVGGFGLSTPSLRLADIVYLAQQARKAGHPFVNDGDTTYRGRTLITLDDGLDDKLYLLPGHADYPVAFVGTPDIYMTFDHWNAPLRVNAPRRAIAVTVTKPSR
jgi:hypothetical protein